GPAPRGPMRTPPAGAAGALVSRAGTAASMAQTPPTGRISCAAPSPARPALTPEDPTTPASSTGIDPARLVVLVSGAGSNLAALLDATADPAYGARVVAVGADRDGLRALDRAQAAGIEPFV